VRLERLDRGDRDTTAGWARGAIARAGLAVRQQLDARDRSARRDLAQAAALALEACATTWEAFGAAGGARRLHLVRGLEQDLAQQERILRAAEAGYRVDRQAVAACARAARAAVERLREGGQDPAGALFALEHNVLALATVAIRAIENIDASDSRSCTPTRVGCWTATTATTSRGGSPNVWSSPCARAPTAAPRRPRVIPGLVRRFGERSRGVLGCGSARASY